LLLKDITEKTTPFESQQPLFQKKEADHTVENTTIKLGTAKDWLRIIKTL
jgi:hypothetical protein